MEQNITYKNIEVWRVRIQDAKNWRVWHASDYNKPYATFNDAYTTMAPWLEANPGRVIQFIKETRQVPV